MLCPDCGYDNISGAEECAECGGSMVAVESQGNEVERGISSHKVSVLCPREPLCVQVDATVREVIAMMAEKNAGCVLVEDGAHLAGVFTERDVLYKISSDLSGLDRPVRDFMTPSPLTITHRDSIGYAMQSMDMGGYRHIPVVNSAGIVTGIISVRTIMRFLCVKYGNLRG